MNRPSLFVALMGVVLFSYGLLRGAGEEGLHKAQLFGYVGDHVHGSTLVELPDRDLLVAWFQGSGERTADDVRIVGARYDRDRLKWSEPFLLADTPGFPDINPVLFLDPTGRLWLVWYTVVAHQWDTSLLKYRISSDLDSGSPIWEWQDVLHVKSGDYAGAGIQPGDSFVSSVRGQLDRYVEYLRDQEISPGEEEVRSWTEETMAKVRGENWKRRGYLLDEEGRRGRELELGYPYYRRMGWQTRNKPYVTASGRVILPLYSDGLDFSIMALTDDLGRTWSFSEPLVGGANIQPALAQRGDGTLVAYMRDNGPPPKRLHRSESTDGGMSWSDVRDSPLPNPGSGADIVELENGHWILAYNDTVEGRHSLAVSLSTDGGRTWPHTRKIEFDSRGSEKGTRAHYPAIIQGADGTLHLSYSYHRRDTEGEPSKTIKYARFTEGWVRAAAP